jgi:hypothetical protein
MSIYYLILTWALVGILAALLALAARPTAATRAGSGWLWLLLSGLCSSLLGGTLGFWLLGRLFSSATAAWVAILALYLPWFFRSLWSATGRTCYA